MGGRERGGEGKGEGEGEEEEGKAKEGRQGKWREEFALVRSIVVAAGAAGWSELATAKPHSSLPLAVADPIFLLLLLFSRLYSISPRCISDPLASPFLVRQSHVRSLRRQLTECFPTLISILAFSPSFLPTYRYARSSLMHSLVSVPTFLFCSSM